jgi:hypothetical protein
MNTSELDENNAFSSGIFILDNEREIKMGLVEVMFQALHQTGLKVNEKDIFLLASLVLNNVCCNLHVQCLLWRTS